MNILVVGDGHSAIHEVAVVAAFKKMGHNVEPFYWQSYFVSRNPLVRLWLRFQNKFLIGPTLNKLNSDLIKKADQFEPRLVFVYRGTHITPQTITEIKRRLPDCIIYGYNNDDPFATGHPPWLWRHFLQCVPIYDIVFSYRKHNITEYYEHDAQRVELLMPWFNPAKDFPRALGELHKAKFDVIFVGHYENDDRIDYIKRIAESNFVLGLFGPDWERAPKLDWLEKYLPIISVRDQLYRDTIMQSKIALCFLSKLNRDTYTRRCFEIPAMGVFMLCQYSEDLSLLFEDGVDVVFFHSPDDMMEKIDYYTRHSKLREQISENGLMRVIRDKHDIISRMDYVLNFLKG
ncbi:MAG: glycosyltransferase [Magnetococcales bacterium]|nr:glycosyltransferase [Magnetococcales bacterium]